MKRNELMQLPIYQIDAFASRVFSGNPAAVCPLNTWLKESVMQYIATENNLSETAFFVPDGEDYQLRWFTPVAEVNLCGHATLATAFVIFNYLDPAKNQVSFSTKSGKLTVTQNKDLLAMDFPAQPPVSCQPPQALLDGLDKEPVKVLQSEDYFVVFEKEKDVRELQPDMNLLKKLGLRGVIVTAKGEQSDFVSRFFAPNYGIDEDPVTGSAHCALTPYWSKVLSKKELHALQLSSRGGELFCQDRGERIIISGRAVKFMEGNITLPI